MNETTTLLKVTMTDLVLRMIEAGVPIKDMTLENPIRAIREISHDMTGRRKVRLSNGKEMSALEIRSVPLPRHRVRRPRRRRPRAPADARAVGPGAQGRRHRGPQPHRPRDRLGHQVQPHRALPGQARPAAVPPRASPRWTSPITTSAAVAACTTCWSAPATSTGWRTSRYIFEAKNVPPQTTRARLRVIRKAQEKRRDFTVDWVHLKLNDQAQRTVLCKDPFKSVDERVDKLIASM